VASSTLVPPDRALLPAARMPARGDAGTARARWRGGTKTVLVAEADPWLGDLLAWLLTGEGYAVLRASNGATGVRLARRHRPDAAVFGAGLPERSGESALADLASDAATRAIPALLLTAGDAARLAGHGGGAVGRAEEVLATRALLLTLRRLLAEGAAGGRAGGLEG